MAEEVKALARRVKVLEETVELLVERAGCRLRWRKPPEIAARSPRRAGLSATSR
jgi:hypothetical protein